MVSIKPGLNEVAASRAFWGKMSADDPKRLSPTYTEIGDILCFREFIAGQSAFD